MLAYRIVLSLALFTASVSSAQAPEEVPLVRAEDAAPLPAPEEVPLVRAEDAAPLPAPVEPQPQLQKPEPAAAEGESIPYRYKPENEAPPDRLLPRLTAELFGGVLSGALMGLAGLLTGAPALRDVRCTRGEVCILPVLLIMVPAAFAGIPVGVQEFAGGFGGRGEFIPTLGGAVLGTGAGFVAGLLSESTGGLIASLILLPVAGAMVGYEISHVLNQREATAAGAASAASAAPRWAPVIGATPRGGILGGLAGSF